jgi:hypothetical protein
LDSRFPGSEEAVEEGVPDDLRRADELATQGF